MIKVDKIPELRNNLQNKNFEKKKESKKDEYNRLWLKAYKEHSCINLERFISEEEIRQIELRLTALEEKLGER